MQVLFFGSLSETFDRPPTDSQAGVVYRKFDEVEALDAHELTVIDLQNNRLWRSKESSPESLNCQNDLYSIASAVEHSEHCKILLLFPQNYCFRFNWEWQGGNRYDYDNSVMLKDIRSYVTDGILRYLTPFPVSLIYGKSETIISDNSFDADFSFNLDTMPPANIQAKSTAGTVTGIQLNDRVFATTLRISDAADLLPLAYAMNILDAEANELPEWLDTVSYLNENILGEELNDIEANLLSLQARKSDIEEVLAANREDKAVLCTKDKDLERRVVSMLAELLEMSNDFIDAKEEDYRYTTDSHILAFEIKGCAKNLQGRHITKTLHHVTIIEEELREGDERAVKGVLIVATEIEKPLSERETLSERQLDLARNYNIGVMSTESLLRLYEAKQEQRLDKEALIELLTTAAGEIDVDSVIRSR